MLWCRVRETFTVIAVSLVVITVADSPLLAEGKASLTLTLKDKVCIYRPTIMLSDLVKERIDKDQDRLIVSSPTWGSKKVITRNFILTRIPRGKFLINGPEKIVVERPLIDRTDEVLNKLGRIIREEVANLFADIAYDSITVEFERAPEEVQLPPGSFDLSYRLPGKLLGYTVVNFEVSTSAGFRRHLAAGCRFHIPVVCAVSKRKIVKGERISESDIVWKKIDLANCTEHPIINDKDVIDMRARRFIPEGVVIPRSAVERYPIVLKGSEVSIDISKGTLRVSARGRSLEDGNLGDRVLVKNLVNNKIEKYQVVGPGRVSPYRGGNRK